MRPVSILLELPFFADPLRAHSARQVPNNRRPSDDRHTTHTKTDSGLEFQISSSAPVRKQCRKQVTVHYTGWLQNPDGAPARSSIPALIADNRSTSPWGRPRDRGWDEGVAGMKVGGKRRLIIPRRSLRRARGCRVIPPMQR